MVEKKKLFVIIGSASPNSSNRKLVDILVKIIADTCTVQIFENLKDLPHFDPERSIDNPPEIIRQFRADIESADGILLCTPEYIFSIPSGLKNAIEWCVSTMVFNGKPTGIITASANGLKGHEELQLIMQTLMAELTEETSILIQGIQGKFDDSGELNDPLIVKQLEDLTEVLMRQITGQKKVQKSI